MDMMTDTTRKVHEALIAGYREKGYCPSIRELCVTAGLKSSASLYHHLGKLETMGLIKRTAYGCRSIELLDRKMIEVTTAEATFLRKAFNEYVAMNNLTPDQTILAGTLNEKLKQCTTDSAS